MNDKRYVLCNGCAEAGRKKFELYLTGWVYNAKGTCSRCKKETNVAEYRLAEQGETPTFSMGAYETGGRR